MNDAAEQFASEMSEQSRPSSNNPRAPIVREHDREAVSRNEPTGAFCKVE
jgi:hypothetical protein